MVPHIYVSVIPGAKGFARTLKQEIEREFQTADIGRLVEQAFGNRTIKVPVKPDFDRSAFGRNGDVAAVGKSLSAMVPDNLLGKVQQLTSSLQGAAGSSALLGGQLAGAFQAASGPAGVAISAALSLAGAIGAAAGAAVFAVPAMTALAGAVASIPGALTGAGAALATLSLGFKGIAAAFKPKSGGGGGGGGGGAGVDLAAQARQVAQATRGVEAAQRSLVRAQRDVVDAQKAVNRAIADEIERREDLNRAVRGAALDQADAALRVDEALRELNIAREAGDIPTIRRAELAYEQAKLQVENTADAAGDLKKEQADAAKTGVKGSDQVQDALRRQQDAMDSLKSATDAVKSAQEQLNAARNPPKSGGGGGGGGGVGDLVKLAPEAQKFVNAIKALAPAFDDLRLNVQNRLFKDLDDTITNLGRAWLPQLHITLGAYADTFNGFFRDLGKNLAKPKFIDDIATGAEGARKGLEAIGKAISGPLVEAFGTLSAASAPFLQALGEEIGKVVTKFSQWVAAGEKSGALQEFFKNAAQAMRDIFDIGGTVASIIGSLIEIIVGKKIGSKAKSPLQEFRDGLEKVSVWLKDPANQQAVRDFFGDLQDSLIQVGTAVQKIDGWITEFKRLKTALFGPGDEGESSSAGQIIGEALVTGIIIGMKEALKAHLEFFIPAGLWKGPTSLIGRIKSGLGIASPSKLTTTMGAELINGLIKGMGDKFAALFAKAAQLPGRIRAGIGTATSILLQKGRDVVAGLGSGIGERFTALYNKVAGLRSRITGPLSDAGSLLYNSGRNVVIGLWNGIASLGGWLWDRVSSFVRNNVSNAVKGALGIASPSKVAADLGRRVPEGLAIGITSGNNLVESAARGMAEAALPSIAPGLVANPARGLSTAAPAGGIELSWRSGSTGDQLLDGLRTMIAARYNGDPAAALGSR